MSINGWMNKEVVAHTYSGILLSLWKEQIWVCSSGMDESKACYTKWSKSEREKQILYINAYIRSLEKWYWWTYLQGRNRNTDIEKRPMDPAGEGEGGTNWESSIETYNIHCHMLNFMKVKEESEKVGLKLNIQKTKTMASSFSTLWQIDGETMETVTDFIFGGLQNHCRWWLQSWN